MTPRQRFLDETLGTEGRYANDPYDSGGETAWGLTEYTARRGGWRGTMRDLAAHPAAAAEIYGRLIWDALLLDQVAELSEAIAYEIGDTAVNCGEGRAVEWLQRTLNALNDGQRHYRDIRVDGHLGPVTLGALAAFLKRRETRGLTVLMRALNALQGAHYIELAERRQKDEKYVFGWLLNRVE